MQIRLGELDSRLAGTLAPVYVVSGDEPLQCEEALEAVRAAARAHGFEERVRLEAGRGFDWSELRQLADSLSLFAQRRLIDLSIPGGKPGEAGAKALVSYAERPSPDNVLLVSTPKLDAASRSTRWYKALDARGVCVQIWPLDPERLPAWVRDRAAREGLTLTGDAARLLAERVEGNLLACAQELKKLSLLLGSRRADPAAVMAAVADSARFSVFDLVESVLAGNPQRVVRIMGGLKEEGVEPVIVAWALGREVRNLASMAEARARGVALERVLARHRVWPKRKRLVTAVLERLSVADLRRLLGRAARIDRVVKGAAVGRTWDELLALGLDLAGVIIFEPKRV